VLKGLESREAPAEVMKVRGFNGKEELTKDFAQLRRELKDEGFFEPSPSHVAYRVAEVGGVPWCVVVGVRKKKTVVAWNKSLGERKRKAWGGR
jgi:hypothetical protein